jgi:predicted N-acetyltransferase YhbS
MGGLARPRPLALDDDLSGFDCGRAALNQWLRRSAQRNQRSGASRTYVVTATDNSEIAGYVSIATTNIRRAWLPKAQQRNQPDPLPAILLGQLAVDIMWQRRGVARALLRFALQTAVVLSERVGCVAVVTHPLDEGARAFYGGFGLHDLPFDPAKSMIITIAELKASGFDTTSGF